MGHGGDDQIGGMTHQQVDLVDVHELGVDAGNIGGIGLVVEINEPHLTAEQPTLGVDLLGPDLLGQQMGFARRGEAPGQRYAESDLDRLLRL